MSADSDRPSWSALLLDLAAGRTVLWDDADPRRQLPAVLEQRRIGDPLASPFRACCGPMPFSMTGRPADPKHLGAKIGITAVLHTWGSAMTHNPHVPLIANKLTQSLPLPSPAKYWGT